MIPQWWCYPLLQAPHSLIYLLTSFPGIQTHTVIIKTIIHLRSNTFSKEKSAHRQRQQNQRPHKFGRLWEKTHWDLETEPVRDSLFYDWPECPSVRHKGLANKDQECKCEVIFFFV